MKSKIITRDILEIFDKYDGDFGMLYERGVPKKDLQKVPMNISILFGQYMDDLYSLRLPMLTIELKEKTLRRIAEIEEVMDPEVARILRVRVLGI
jgi:hypothetical protein